MAERLELIDGSNITRPVSPKPFAMTCHTFPTLRPERGLGDWSITIPMSCLMSVHSGVMPVLPSCITLHTRYDDGHRRPALPAQTTSDVD